MIGREFESRKEKYKIGVVAGLLTGAFCLTYYFHAVLKVDTVVTHLFYLPIILASYWWQRKGLIVAVFSSVFLVFSHIFLMPDVATANDYFRALMFIVIGLVVAELSGGITKEKDAVREQSELLRDTIESLSHPFYVIDVSDYTIQMANRAALGSRSCTGGITCYGLIRRSEKPCEGPEHICPVKRVKETKKAVVAEHVHFDENDNERIVEVHAHPVLDSQGNVIRMIEYCLDITERRRAEEAARDVQEELLEQRLHEKERVEAELAKVREELIRKTRLAAIGQVSASIAHDLRNPLGTVRNATYFLRRHFHGAEPGFVEYTEMIDQEVVKADRIITNLLEMAQPKAPHKGAVDLGEIIKDVFSRAKRVKGVRCRTSMSPEPFVVLADANQIRQVVGNIVDNAAEAMKGQGEIFVEAGRGSDYDTIVFRDTGPGFGPGVGENVFEALVTTKASGTGLGLTICRQIVEKHGGTITAEDCEGEGAAIRIRLPRE